MMKYLPLSPENIVNKLGLLGVIPAIVLLASCATPTEPVAHRHGALVHSHVIGLADDHTHTELAKVSTTSVSKAAKAKVTSTSRVAAKKITPAKPEDIKSLGLFHQHHNHVDPITGQSGVPC